MERDNTNGEEKYKGGGDKGEEEGEGEYGEGREGKR